MNENNKPGAGPRPVRAPGQAAPRIRSTDLFQGNRQAVIVHGDEEYRLQQTRTGKLILTK